MKKILKNWLFITAVLALVFSALGSTRVSAAVTPPDATADRVYGQSGSFVTGGFTSGGALNYPARLRVDSGGNLYVADEDNNRVLYYPAGSTTATRVYGQGGDMSSNASNKGGISADSLYGPIAVAIDSSGNLYIADKQNSRVLYYPAGSTTATRVYGQAGDFTTDIQNKAGISADSLYKPAGLALDASDNLYIADCYNERVLYYPAGSITATRVYGQGGVFNTNLTNKGGVSADSLSNPTGLALDSGGLYVSDTVNRRVLYYAGASTTATRVYGQGGVFTTITSNKGGISADSLAFPRDVSLDSNGNLAVADEYNSRVLIFAAGSTTATRVYGQGGVFTTAAVNKNGLSADSLNNPYGVAFDGSDNLYVADYYNHRVLYFFGISTTATRVYGQFGSFTGAIANRPAAVNLASPASGVADGSGNLYVADKDNHRVLYFPSGSTTPTRVYGQAGDFTTRDVNNGGISANSLNAPQGLALDASGNLYVVDKMNNRVLYYPSGSTTATRVYGQAGSLTTNGINQGGISADSLNNPSGVSVRADGVYIADANNNRVLYYAGTSTTATRVYGQNGSFLTIDANLAGTNPSQGTLSYPTRIFATSSGVYIADTNNNRVLYYAGTDTTATRVYGQDGLFTSGAANGAGITANTLSAPMGLKEDADGNLYVADSGNSRVLLFPAGSTSASFVYGQDGSFTSGDVNKGGVSASSLNFPSDLFLDSSGNLNVADTDNNRVLTFTNSQNWFLFFPVVSGNP